MNTLFLVGPGGVGKSTTGPLVAALMARRFVDLDERFTADHGSISDYVAGLGYRAYCLANAALAERIVGESDGRLVIATSSGFLAHNGCDDVVDRNLSLVRQAGTSVFLMPAADLDAASRIIAFRQLRRWPERDLAAEYTIAHTRCGRYMACADRLVITSGTPHEAANQVVVELLTEPVNLIGSPRVAQAAAHV